MRKLSFDISAELSLSTCSTIAEHAIIRQDSSTEAGSTSDVAKPKLMAKVELWSES